MSKISCLNFGFNHNFDCLLVATDPGAIEFILILCCPKSLARDLGQHNIRINSIAPGSVATKRQSKLWLNPKFKQEILDKQCLKKQVLPEDVSRMVLYLASDVSSGCTKQNFTVDAGLI